MSNTYVKTNWANGDTLSAERFNHMEAGVENIVNGGISVVYDQDNTLDKNFAQISEMLDGEQLVAIKSGVKLLGFVNGCLNVNGYYRLYTIGCLPYKSTSPDGILSQELDA